MADAAEPEKTEPGTPGSGTPGSGTPGSGTPGSGTPGSGESEPDYRFTLANERTLLAYLRTALALDAAGLAAVQFLTDIGSHWVRALIGALLAGSGTIAASGGYLRWRSIQQAMRRSQPLPRADVPLLMALVVAALSVVALVGVLVR